MRSGSSHSCLRLQPSQGWLGAIVSAVTGQTLPSKLSCPITGFWMAAKAKIGATKAGTLMEIWSGRVRSRRSPSCILNSRLIMRMWGLSRRAWVRMAKFKPSSAQASSSVWASRIPANSRVFSERKLPTTMLSPWAVGWASLWSRGDSLIPTTRMPCCWSTEKIR